VFIIIILMQLLCIYLLFYLFIYLSIYFNYTWVLPVGVATTVACNTGITHSKCSVLLCPVVLAGDALEYLNLALKDGGVSVTMNLGNGRLELHIKPNRVRFDDNQWHKVTVHRKVQEVGAICMPLFDWLMSLGTGTFSPNVLSVAPLLTFSTYMYTFMHTYIHTHTN
jgi:hypothetical protein